jgi:hypothetical protein
MARIPAPFFSRPWTAGMPEMPEHFPAGALMARHPENERRSRLNRQGENAEAIFGFRVT